VAEPEEITALRLKAIGLLDTALKITEETCAGSFEIGEFHMSCRMALLKRSIFVAVVAASLSSLGGPLLADGSAVSQPFQGSAMTVRTKQPTKVAACRLDFSLRPR
jgi:hypothetical protein